MKFTIDKHEKYVVIQPHVEVLDGDSAPKIKAEFLLRNTGGQRNIVFDLSQVKEADSSGLRTGLLAHRLCKAAGGVFILACANQQIKNLISMCKLDEVLTVAPNTADAEDLIFSKELEKDLRGAVEEG
ncbi:STAS domain-containing protein [Parapedobacter koreensis]|uniref:Anti-anti-sigma factor n=1 Tax=Parapedobacter koreensis TaxID=332977 RepID=A0A1H7S3T4_9SPHI|nr:STAS domain-containing protein [Parapedobacter koreensis]SEL67145.1 anti-anti-sigma factor [Parapedobacter koreensis]